MNGTAKKIILYNSSTIKLKDIELHYMFQGSSEVRCGPRVQSYKYASINVPSFMESIHVFDNNPRLWSVGRVQEIKALRERENMYSYKFRHPKTLPVNFLEL